MGVFDRTPGKREREREHFGSSQPAAPSGALESGPLGLLAVPSGSTGWTSLEVEGGLSHSAAGISLKWPVSSLNPTAALFREGWPASRGTRHTSTLRNPGGSCRATSTLSSRMASSSKEGPATRGGQKVERNHRETPRQKRQRRRRGHKSQPEGPEQGGDQAKARR